MSSGTLMLRTLAALAGLLLASPAAAVTYLVTVDTSAAPTSPAALDFQFNPGTASTQAAFAEISHFELSGGALLGSPELSGAVSGLLPGAVRIDSTAANNGFLQTVQPGTSLRFLLRFDGPALQAPDGTARSGSRFGLALYDEAGGTPLLSVDPNGFAGIADVRLDGSVATTTFSAGPGLPPIVTFSAVGDRDGDGVTDLPDDCPFFANPDQTDTDADGRGDACECGDQNGDGRSTVADLVAINLAIFNPGLATPLCDANGDARCDVGDIVAVNLEIFSPGNTSTCERQPEPGP